MKLGEIFVALGFQVDDEKLKSFDKGVKELKGTLRNTVLAAAAALYAIDRFVDGSVKGAAAMRNFRLQTGLSEQELKKWQAASQLSNIAISADEVTTSIQALQENLAQIRMGKGNLAPFQILGIDIQNQDAFGVLDQLRSKVRSRDRAQVVNLMKEMGINPGMLNILLKTREEFDELTKGFVLSKEATNNLLQLGSAIGTLKLKFAFWKDEFVAKHTPQLMKLIDVIYRLAEGIGNVAHVLFEVGGALAEVLPQFKALLPLVAMLTAIFFPLQTILAAFFLILEDIGTYMKGGDSVTGRLIDAFRSVRDYLADAFKPLTDALEKAERFINKYPRLKKAVDQLTPNVMSDNFTAKDILFGGVGNLLPKFLVNPLGLKMPDLFNGSKTPPAPAPQTNISSPKIIQNTFDIKTNGDAKETANEIDEIFRRRGFLLDQTKLDQTQANFNNSRSW